MIARSIYTTSLKACYCCSEKGVIEQDEVEQELLSEAENTWAQREWSIQHVLFPSMRLFFKPQTSMATDGTFVQVLVLICLP